jgi:hypothetical protein
MPEGILGKEEEGFVPDIDLLKVIANVRRKDMDAKES